MTVETDRADYARFLAAYGFTEGFVRAVVEDMRDHAELPPGFEHLHLAESPIQGVGVYSSVAICEGAAVGPARIGSCRTLLGRRMNHSASPNCAFVKAPGGGLDVVARGCIEPGEELTVSYWQAGEVNGYGEPNNLTLGRATLLVG